MDLTSASFLTLNIGIILFTLLLGNYILRRKIRSASDSNRGARRSFNSFDYVLVSRQTC